MQYLRGADHLEMGFNEARKVSILSTERHVGLVNDTRKD